MLERLFLSIFRNAVVLLMALSLVAVAVLIALSVFEYVQREAKPAPAQVAPPVDVPGSEVSQFIQQQTIKQSSEHGKAESDAEAEVSTKPDPVLYIAEVSKIYQCSLKFSRTIGVSVDDSPEANAKNIESLREQIQKVALVRGRGDPFVKSLAVFACDAMNNPDLINARKAGKIPSVVIPLLNYHITRWDALQAQKQANDEAERQRVEDQKIAEGVRVSAAHALALTLLTAAGAAFAAFMVLALYLMFARIESNLRDINESIKASRI